MATITLKNELELLKSELELLKRDHSKLQNDYSQLRSDHSQLQSDYSENVIIQSMKEMKERYDRMLRTTVHISKYDLLNKNYNNLIKTFSGCTVLLEHSKKKVKELVNFYNPEYKSNIYKLQSELETIKDIIENITEHA